jgi:hypothetical protein
MPSGPLREVGVGGLSVYLIQTKSAIIATKFSILALSWRRTIPGPALFKQPLSQITIKILID